MNRLTVICVDDERDILASLEYDLRELGDCLDVELCESAQEAIETIDYLNKQDETIALIITDQMMPGLKGSDLLNELNQCPGVEQTKAVLLTGQATQEDTINAVNSLRLDYYISKPWKKEELLYIVKELLTSYVIERELNPQPFLRHLNTGRLLEEGSSHVGGE